MKQPKTTINQAEATPRLSEACRDYVGHTLELRFHHKFLVWTQVIDGNSGEYPDMAKVDGFVVKIVPTDFFAQRDVSIRGFRGRIIDESGWFSDFYAVAVPGLSGTEFNFTDMPCADWRVWLSRHELPAPTLGFQQLRGIDMIAGFGYIFQAQEATRMTRKRREKPRAENMRNTEETIWDTITNSAKERFDYRSLEAVFQETDNDNFAENILFKMILGLSAGQTKEDLTTQLTTDMALIGLGFKEHYLENLLEHKAEELSTEILATQFARSMLDQGSHPVPILEAVHKMLNWPAAKSDEHAP
jgi:hypothetical protein